MLRIDILVVLAIILKYDFHKILCTTSYNYFFFIKIDLSILQIVKLFFKYKTISHNVYGNKKKILI